MKNHKIEIQKLEAAAGVIDKLVKTASDGIVEGKKYITDRLDNISADIKDIAESLRQVGVPDAELLDA